MVEIGWAVRPASRVIRKSLAAKLSDVSTDFIVPMAGPAGVYCRYPDQIAAPYDRKVAHWPRGESV